LALLAMLALLLQALVPDYVVAAAETDQADLIPICTGNEIIYIAVDEDGRLIPPKPSPKKHCEYCLTQAEPLALLPQAISLTVGVVFSTDLQISLSDELATAKARVSPGPIRAPPYIS